MRERDKLAAIVAYILTKPAPCILKELADSPRIEYAMAILKAEGILLLHYELALA